jgi:hypothetical protein
MVNWIRPSGSCCQPSMILVYPLAGGSLMIRRASARAASTGPRKVSVAGGRFDISPGEAVQLETFGSLFRAIAAVLLVKSLSTGPLGVPCRASNFPSSAVSRVRALICLLPCSALCMFLFPRRVRSGQDHVVSSNPSPPLSSNPNFSNWFREATMRRLARL